MFLLGLYAAFRKIYLSWRRVSHGQVLFDPVVHSVQMHGHVHPALPGGGHGVDLSWNIVAELLFPQDYCLVSQLRVWIVRDRPEQWIINLKCENLEYGKEKMTLPKLPFL